MSTLHADIEVRELITCAAVAVGRAGRVFASGLDWTVRPGEWWWIEGANGSGKTTLLATVLGELPALAGSITLHPWISDGGMLATVAQLDELQPTLPLAVEEYVALGLPGGRGDRASVLVAVADVGLEPGRSYWALSGGQRQRARIARALARRPALLVLDEPFNHLDGESVAACLRACERRRADGLAVLCVAHRPPGAAATGRVLIGDGRFSVEPS